MRVLLTGATGFIGSHLVSRLLAEGHLPVALVSGERQDDRVECHRWSPPELPSAVTAAEFERVILLGWDLSQRNDWTAQAAQLVRFAQLTPLMARSGGVVGLGTSEEYGPAQGRIEEATQAQHPRSPYGWAKGAAAEMARSATTDGSLVWLRPFIVYGPGQTGPMLVPHAIRAAARGDRADFTDGEQERDFVHVRDVVEAIVRALQVEGSHTLNVATGVPTKVRSVIERIAALAKTDAFRIGAVPRRSWTPERHVGDPSRMAKVLGFQPPDRLDAALPELLAAERRAPSD